MCNIVYEDRTCVFIDILGWKDAINHLSAKEIYEILKPFLVIYQDHRNRHASIKNARKNSVNTHTEENQYSISTIDEDGQPYEVPTMYEQVHLTVFSDSLVLSMPLAFEHRIYSKLPSIIIGFLEKGFLLRGGISVGKLYHIDNIIFGPALVEAHKLESNEAKFPRILISDKVIDEIEPHPCLPIMKDQINNWVINPFPKEYEFNYNDQQMLSFLNENYKVEKVTRIIEQKIKEYSKDYSL
ncbi:hypothetical protein [Legionella cincinnatiensis]|uniref:Uncharacterized protein n=1 Tax=Legionella cincinnatiensis TaxID=28085 RepID=A0A378IJU7_9GAMM|nr:hypothetical protein [Legionella cincinnatiensis]KTC78705.1 hypothetical protein Lcin_3320 [Legionella cincinnatiensis]STX35293.1 Uncharacterised protein [Legionella cincinnatiensis]